MQDEDYMRMALNLAKKGLGKTSPNPMVGAVIVKNKKIAGKGFHKKYGRPHAEVDALGKAGRKAYGATLYVNLEPCCFYGKTPPCTEAIIKSGIKKVVCATYDPNPKVKGKGIKKLMEKKIEVKMGILEKEAKKLNEVYFKFIRYKLPFVILLQNLSLDGKMVSPICFSGSFEFQRFLKKLNTEVDGVLVDSNEAKNLIWFFKREKGKPRLFIVDKQKKDVINLLHNLAKDNILSLLVRGGKEILTPLLKNKLVDKIYFFFTFEIFGKGEQPFGELGVFQVSDSVYLEDVRVKKLSDGFLLSGYPVGRR